MKCEEVARLMGPYLDGELDLVACVGVEEHLDSCPACRRILENQEALVAVIREQVPASKASPFLKTRILASLRAETAPEKLPWWQSIPWRWIFSGLVGALCLIALGLFLSMPGAGARLAQEAIIDHVRSLQVNHLMDVASTDQHTVKPWFAGKLDFSPQVIDLGPSGYPLIGGRLDVLDGRNVAAIIYQRRKHYINLFTWPSDRAAGGENSYEKDGYRVFEWTRGGMKYVAVSELGEKELREFTAMIKDQAVPPME